MKLLAALLAFQIIPFPGPGRAPAGGGGGGITHVQTVCAAGASGASCPTGDGGTTGTTRAVSITATTGSTLKVVVAWYGSQTISSVADGTNTYTQDVASDAGSTEKVAIWSAHNITGGSLTITVTMSSTGSYNVTYVSEFTGLTSSGSLECSATGSATGTSITTSNCTTTTANTMVLAAYAYGGGGTTTTTAGTGYTIPTNGVYENGTAMVASAVEYKIISATGTHNGTFTISSGGSSHKSVVAGYK